jgi:SAM-dependent methyltransferase
MGRAAITGRLYRRAARQAPEGVVRCPATGEEHLEYRGAERALAGACRIQRLLRRGGFAAFYYPARTAWGAEQVPGAPEGEYWRACRDAAGRGRKIVRVYVVREPLQLDDGCLLRMVNEDARAGIESLYLPEWKIPSHYPRDFAIWDDELYAESCFTPGAAGLELAACRLFRDARHLADADELRRGILRAASRCTGLPSEDSLLAESVGEQYRMALELCRADGAGSESCSWYHGSWHLLRACGVVVTPAWHRDFYAASIHEAVRRRIEARGKAAILISGLADYGMLYHVAAAVGPNLIGKCEIDLLDLCEVPLRMGRWLQERVQRSPAGLRIPLRGLLRQDLLSGRLPAAAYDLIVSDAFITRFERLADRKKVVEEWRRLLAPGGFAVTTVKFCSFFDEFPPSAMWRRRFVERALERRPPYVPSGELAGLAHEYARRLHSFPFPDVAHVRDFLASFAGLELRTCRIDGEGSEVIGTPFAQVVLCRRAT